MNAPALDLTVDLASELDRKSFEALEELASRHIRGDITTHAYCEALRALDRAMRGLVDEKYCLAVDHELTLHEPRETMVRAYQSPTGVYVVRYISGNDYFIVRVSNGVKISTERTVMGEGSDPVRDAYEKFRKTAQKLKTLYQEL